MGFALACGGRFDEADSVFRSALAMDSIQDEAIFLRGVAALWRGDPAGAIGNLEKARERYPEADEALGYACVRLGCTADARAIIRARELLAPPGVNRSV